MSARHAHQPMRRCVACYRSCPQTELIRWHQDDAGRWQPDPARRAGGRGAWVCRDNPSCHQEKKLKRFFRAQAAQVARYLQQACERPEQEPHTSEAHTKQPPTRVRVRRDHVTQLTETSGGVNG